MARTVRIIYEHNSILSFVWASGSWDIIFLLLNSANLVSILFGGRASRTNYHILFYTNEDMCFYLLTMNYFLLIVAVGVFVWLHSYISVTLFSLNDLRGVSILMVFLLSVTNVVANQLNFWTS